MTHDEMIAIITAHKEGKQIQISLRNSKKWEDCMGKPDWDFRHFDYRVKPEPPKPKYRPYNYADEFFAEVKKHGSWVIGKHYVGVSMITNIENGVVWLNGSECTMNNLLCNYVWADDGSPCGILEE